MIIDLSINPSKTTGKITNFIKSTVNDNGFSRIVLGLSGGVDSAVSLYLAVKALGAENVHAGIFPYGKLNDEAKTDALMITSKLNIPKTNIHITDISSLVDPILEINKGSDLRRGNIMARIRMIFLYDLSKKYNALVIGTENKTEQILGYYTRYGDEASDIEPIIHLYKTQVKQLAKYLLIPQDLINKPPTAGMWAGQTDEGEFGFTYEIADQILFLYTNGKNKEEIIESGFDQKTVDLVIKKLEVNKFKEKVPYRL